MTRFAVKNPVTVLVMAFILIIAGLGAYLALPRESFPEIKIPLIYVNTIYLGASPEDIENLVTQKIEDKLEGLDGVKRITSQSVEGVSAIQVEFVPTVDVETALRRVKDKVDAARGDIPTDAKDPVVQELNFSNIPVFIISLSSDYPMEKLEGLATELRDRLAEVPGVLEAKVTGKQEKEVAIDADPALLRQYGLNLGDLVKTVQTQHRNIPGGTLRAAGERFSIHVTGELQDPQAFRDLVVRSDNGKLVRVGDVAKVSYGYARARASIARLNGKPALAVTVTKRTGENIIQVIDASKKVVEERRASWPAGTKVDYTMDQSTRIREMVNELQNHIVTGLVLVVGLISFFLGLRNSFFISTAIPFSMMMGFLFLRSLGVTLNMVVLFSLVIALGMLVDDGIVVVENIYRHLHMGKTRLQAAIDGTREVAIPVTTATVTTVAAFLPILWMPGIMGQFMKYIPITVSVTLMGSLFVAFVFNPVFASLFMNSKDDHTEERAEGWFANFRDRYARLIGHTLGRHWWVALGCVAFIILGIMAYGALGTGAVFFPKSEPEVVYAGVEGPLGYDINQTDSAVAVLERAILAMPEDQGDVKYVSVVVGSAIPENGAAGGYQSEPNKGYVQITFQDYNERKVSSWKSMQWLEANLARHLPGWKVDVKEQQGGPPQGHPVSYEVIGDDFQVLGSLAAQVKDKLARIPSLANVNWDYDAAQPEIKVAVDREQASRLGVSTTDVAMAVRGSIYGTEAAKWREGKDENSIMVRLDPGTRESFSGLDQITINHEGSPIPLTSVARVEQGASFSAIRHLDGRRTVQVWGDLAPGQRDESKPKQAAAAEIAKLRVPAGYILRTGSSNRDQQEAQAFIGKAFLIAAALVFMTMVFQFNSVFQPVLVLIGILLSLGGVFWGLLFIHVTFSIIMTGVGIIALAGVVAKNAIVLIDFINHLRREGLPLREAVVEGGRTRLRPVLLTAITAMIGLLPMATGVGMDFFHLKPQLRSETSGLWAPMAWAIFWGLLFNTILSLVVVPTFYYGWENFKARRAARRGAPAGPAEAATAHGGR